MGAAALEQQTHLPEQPEAVAKVLDFLEAHEVATGSRPVPRYLLVGADQADSVEIPEAVYRAFRQVVEALNAGNAVTISTHRQTLTTQQAAELLGVSRPTVVKLIERGELPAEKVGTRRRMLELDDVLAYRKKRREQQFRALIETSTGGDEDHESPEALAEEFRRIRAEISAERKARKGSG